MTAPDHLGRLLRLTHLRLLGALHDGCKLNQAAAVLNVSQPAASRLLREVEELLGMRLHEKAGRNLALTVEGRQIAQRAAQVLEHVTEFHRDVRQLRSGQQGQVAVGAVTEPAVKYVLPAIRSLRMQSPDIRVRVDVNSSDVLVPRLMSGQLDFALARRPADVPAAEIEEVPLLSEPIEFLVRHGHPLLGEARVPLPKLLEFDWVLPFEGTIMRNTVETFLAAHRLPPPLHVTATSSFLMTLALISQTNAIAPLAAGVRETFEDQGVRPVRIVEQIEVAPYALLWVRGRSHSVAARSLLGILGARFPRIAEAIAPESSPPGHRTDTKY